MDDLLKARISECRLRLGNPYAFIEYLEDASNVYSMRADAGGASSLEPTRYELQNPYAYVDEYGVTPRTSVSSASVRALAPPPSLSARRETSRLSDHQIEAEVRKLQTRLWNERQHLWNGNVPSDPVDILDIKVALGLVGYSLRFEPGLGRYLGDSGYIEVAGLIDRDSKTVRISQQFLPAVQAFTSAHELGHAVLHGVGGGVHRDKPIEGGIRSHDPDEMEADKFATYFLMPGKLVSARFREFFRANCFELTEATAFALGAKNPDIARAEFPTRRALARRLASVEHFDGRFFKSLADQFKVSVEAMAIRLEELGLVSR